MGVVGLAGAGLGCSAAVNDKDVGEGNAELANNVQFDNGFGKADFFSTQNGKVDTDPTTNPFFRNLGANGRTCNSCHKLEDGMGISAARIQAIFNASNGLDPIFRINDGSNAPTGPYSVTSSVTSRRQSFSMLLNKGLIRVGIGVPANANFTLIQTLDPFYFASAAELSLFRRPLPSVNVKANVLAMWDGRESEGRPAIRDALINQANDATQGHAQRATPLDLTTRQQIADFQLNLFNAQIISNVIGSLTTPGCAECDPPRGGAFNLSEAVAHGSPGGSEGPLPASSEGVNNPFLPLCPDPGTTPANDTTCFKNVSMTFFDPIESDAIPADGTTLTKNRGELGDGENIFYTKPIRITGVAGLNDASHQVINGFCTTCHNTPEVGNHSFKRFMNTGLSDPYLANNPLAGNIIEFPKYVLDPNSNPGAYITTTDPGLALRTGQFADINKFKVPNLRGLGSRAPYFHNGAAKTLDDVVNFYDKRFNIGFTSEEKRKVILFLQQT